MNRSTVIGFQLRDPVSSASHLFGCVLALYLTALLWRLSRQDRLRQWSIFCFCMSCILLYGISGTYHAILAPESLIEFFQRLDHSAIYVLIAGTYTPVFAVLLRGRLRVGLLALIWGLALMGIACKWLLPLGPYWLSVGLYIAIGWVGMLALVPLIRVVGWRAMLLGLSGGVCYTIGGVCDALGKPTLYPGLIGSHEVLHLMDLLGTYVHVIFMIRYVVPCPTLVSDTAETLCVSSLMDEDLDERSLKELP